MFKIETPYFNGWFAWFAFHQMGDWKHDSIAVSLISLCIGENVTESDGKTARTYVGETPVDICCCCCIDKYNSARKSVISWKESVRGGLKAKAKEKNSRVEILFRDILLHWRQNADRNTMQVAIEKIQKFLADATKDSFNGVDNSIIPNLEIGHGTTLSIDDNKYAKLLEHDLCEASLKISEIMNSVRSDDGATNWGKCPIVKYIMATSFATTLNTISSLSLSNISADDLKASLKREDLSNTGDAKRNVPHDSVQKLLNQNQHRVVELYTLIHDQSFKLSQQPKSISDIRGDEKKRFEAKENDVDPFDTFKDFISDLARYHQVTTSPLIYYCHFWNGTPKSLLSEDDKKAMLNSLWNDSVDKFVNHGITPTINVLTGKIQAKRRCASSGTICCLLALLVLTVIAIAITWIILQLKN